MTPTITVDLIDLIFIVVSACIFSFVVLFAIIFTIAEKAEKKKDESIFGEDVDNNNKS